MASFERLPSGRWRAVTWDPYRKRKGKTKTFDADVDRPDRAPVEAESWADGEELKIYRANKANGIEVGRKAKPITFADYVSSWAQSRSGKPSTVQTARSHARAPARVWPDERLADITPTMIKAMLLDLEVRGMSASTREGRLSTLRRIMRDVVAEGLWPDDPCTDIRGPKTSRDAGRHRPITEDELPET